MSTGLEPLSGSPGAETLGISPSIDPFVLKMFHLATQCSQEGQQIEPSLGQVSFVLDEGDLTILRVAAMMGEARYYGRTRATPQELANSLVWLKQAQG